MSQAAAIIGTGQTRHCAVRRDVNIPDMINEAVIRALEDSTLTIEDIDSIVIGNMEHFEGINLSDMWALEGVGGFLKPTIKVATGGCTGTSVGIAGYYHVASGLHETCLAVGWEALSASSGETTTGIITAFDPFFERPTLAGAISGLGIFAQRYMHETGVTEEQAALVTVEARKKAAKNPYAHLSRQVTVEEVLKSPVLSYPLKYLDMCPTSDGACAVVYASEKTVRKIGCKAAYVSAVDSAHNHTYLGDAICFHGEQLKTLSLAAERAYKKAGIRKPLEDLDVVEIYEPSTYALLHWMEFLHFCDPGQGFRLVEDGVVGLGGKLPVNPSGGVLCTNPIGATGLIRVAEAAAQVLGRAGSHQVDGVKCSMATGFGGSNWNEILIFKNQMDKA